MKEKSIKILILIIFVMTLSGCNNKITNVETKRLNTCNNKPQLLLTKEDKNVYTYCLEDTKINIDKKTYNLKEYIKNNDNAIEKIIATLKHFSTLYDGGTKIYKSDTITLVKCNTIEGNKDIYIGNENMEFKENFCKDDNYTFVRTYKIKNIEKYTEQQYENGIPVTYSNSYKVELKEFQGKTETVIINNLIEMPLEKDKTYEFEFMLYDSAINIEDTIQYIFQNSTIVEVRETNKIGLEQISEKIK